MLNWAIVGCGLISDLRIAPALMNSGINRLAAVVSRDEGKAAAFALRHGAEKSFGSLERMLREQAIDVVYLGTPNALHASQAVAACRAGKHVFCDKPMALTIVDCEAMIRTAEVSSVKLGVGFNNRYDAVHAEARRRIQAGAIGEVLFASAHKGAKGARVSWRQEGELAGGGTILDSGVHMIDILRFLTGREVVQLSALLDTSTYGWPLDEVVSSVMEFEGGVHALLNTSQKYPFGCSGTEVYGTKGALLAVGTFGSVLMPEHPPAGYLDMITADGTRRTEFLTVDAFRAECDAFGEAVVRDVEPPVSGIDGLRVQEAVLAMQESAQTGRTVRLRRVSGTTGRSKGGTLCSP